MLSEEEYAKVAKESLIQYPIICDELVYLGKSDNVTFLVHTNDENQKYLIKIHISTSSNKTKDNIESELIWLEALDGDTDLFVPVPIRNLEGDLVTEISTYHNDNKFIVTIHHWVNGEVLMREPTSNETANLALLMAALHKHSMQWNAPDGFNRPIYNSDHLYLSLNQLKHLLNLELMSSEAFAYVEESAHKIANVIQSHKRLQSNWGIIHSDLHESNYVFYEDIPRPIDFSNCGYGFYLFDMAETFLHLSFENRKIFIASYSKVHQLQENYIELLEAFFIWSIIRTFAFHSLNPIEHQSLAESFPSVIEDYFIKYLKGEHFLLNSHEN
ncbi:phosphotransferase enzyme family protein [Brevibacillus reuszeri]|uniref:Aminoglycoside phosphotransferase n=2 Tax=Brevibacillus reuszeri TaxID=54915 RepID=A0A0K9YWJ3_9BACL|nr:phosphotransferase [Brevibacillus reuszeri]KNB73058.1 aminoglycoside phosphotransferase [Brevibacillus reuszeri]MED1861596.1 phosphotransferase [Brevibacillus reuszeri]